MLSEKRDLRFAQYDKLALKEVLKWLGKNSPGRLAQVQALGGD
jgi:hypothetical protein